MIRSTISHGAAPFSRAAIPQVQGVTARQGGGIGNVEWRVNGVVLGLDRASSISGSNPELRKTLALVPGENRIEVVAFDAKGWIASDAAEVTINSTQAKSTKPPRLFVLSVGVNEYANSLLPRLHFAVADAGELGGALKQLGGKLYDSIEVTNISRSRRYGAQFGSGHELAQKVTPDDVFVLFLSGHGKTLDGRFYFIPQDYAAQFRSEDIESHAISQDLWFPKISSDAIRVVRRENQRIIRHDACDRLPACNTCCRCFQVTAPA